MIYLITASDRNHPSNLIKEDDVFSIKTLLENPFEYAIVHLTYEKWIVGVDSLKCKIDSPLKEKSSFRIGLDHPDDEDAWDLDNVYCLTIWEFLIMVAEQYEDVWKNNRGLFGKYKLEDLWITEMKLKGDVLKVKVEADTSNDN